MSNRIIITIAREYGSGGREVGKLLAEKLGIAFYDKELIALAAKESGINQDLFEDADEKPANPFWSSMAFNVGTFGSRAPSLNDMPMNDKLFLIQADVIRKVSQEGSCVIVGRCADYILEKEERVLHVFLHGKEEDKLQRVIHSYGIPEHAARDFMRKTDKKRAAYYDYYVGEKWGQMGRYDLSVDTSTLGIDNCVKLIAECAKMKFEK